MQILWLRISFIHCCELQGIYSPVIHLSHDCDSFWANDTNWYNMNVYTNSCEDPLHDAIHAIICTSTCVSEGLGHIFHRTDSKFAPSQWETALLNKDVSHLLGASLESALFQYLGRDQFSATHKETKIFSINGVVWSAWRAFACDDLYLPWYYLPLTCRLISAATEMTAAIYEPLAVHFPVPKIRRD